MVNQNWQRWIFASTTKAFFLSRQGIAFYFQSLEAKRDIREDYFQFHLEGPDYEECTKDEFEIFFNIVILTSSVIDDRDAHKHSRLIGIGTAMFLKAINIFKYGDDDSYLGCAQLISDIEVINYGLANRMSKLMSSTITARYRMELSNG